MKKILILVIPILFLSSCVVYYKTEDVRKTIVSNVNTAKENQSSTDNDYRDKLDAYQWLEGYILNKNLEPFKSITKHKNEMSKSYEALRLKTDEIKALQFTFESLAKGKKKIKSDEEIWQDFKEIKKNMKRISAEIDRLNPKYAAASNALGNAISNSHFKILNKNELKTNIENNISQLRESSESTRIKITRYRRELDNAKNKIADSTYTQRSEMLNQMDQLLSGTENTQTDIQSALAELLKPLMLRSRNEIWTGKNTTTQKNIQIIQDGISQIKETQALFNKLASSLNENTGE
tara:strand:+ start:5692 stop:6570 length:879 start_codon:yes stop_codon:yes gene_type:complete